MIQINKGDFLSEVARLQIIEIQFGKVRLKNLSTQEEVFYSAEYTREYCKSASYIQRTEVVGAEDKYWTAKQIAAVHEETARPGDLRTRGIQTIFKSIGSHAFTVVFTKKNKDKTHRDYTSEMGAWAQEIKDAVLEGKDIYDLLANPVLKYEPGEERKMICVKQQFDSIDGFYEVIDLEINEKRQVNINTIKSIIYDGVEYIVK